jgi:hypothetical protein
MQLSSVTVAPLKVAEESVRAATESLKNWVSIRLWFPMGGQRLTCNNLDIAMFLVMSLAMPDVSRE